MKKIITALTYLIIGTTLNINATNYYLSTSGSDSNSGTSSSNAFKTLEYAVSVLSAGDVLNVSSGTYNESNTIVIQTNGTSSNPITINGSSNRPVFHFDGNESSSNRGIVMDGDYWVWNNVIIENAGDNGMLLSGNNNTINNCVFRENYDTGLQLSRYNTSASSISEWPTNNTIIDCEAYDNCDTDNEDADGFAAKLTCGEGNVFKNCVAHHNIDDGWDLYTKSSTGAIGVVKFYNCIAHNNGTLSNGSASGSGDKNGYKLGSSSNKVNHILVNCVAFNNGKHGFTDNGNTSSIKFINLTSYGNGDYNYHTRDGASHQFVNCISYDGKDRIVGTASTSHNALIDDDFDFDYTVSSSDFASLTAGSDADPCSGDFLKLSSSSSLIDAGTTSSYLSSYSGSAPDLGAFEYGDDSGSDEDEEDSEEGSITLSTSAGDGYVTLNWSISNIDVRNIQIYRDTDSDPSGRGRIATGSGTSYTDSDVSNGTTYYYWVKVVDQDLNVYNSDYSSATPSDGSSGSSEDQVHNFTESGKSSSFFDITGNLSTSKGTVTYNGLTLTQCLKIETSTNISFTTTEEASITLVFNSDYSGRIYIDGTSYDVSSGVLTTTLASGSHEITKRDVANLYYMSLSYLKSASINISSEQNNSFLVEQNYPNPFINSTTIPFTLKSDSHVNLSITDMSGKQVAVLLNSTMSSGKHSVHINADELNLSKGMYVYKLVSNEGVVSKIMLKK